MPAINGLDDLRERRIIIYGAGSVGRSVLTLLREKARNPNVAGFCDTYKAGIDKKTGLKILRPSQLAGYLDCVVVIGISDLLKPSDAGKIENDLYEIGFTPETVVLYSHFVSFFSRFREDEFNWQTFSDDLYDFDTNLKLIQCIARYVSEQDQSVADLGAGSMNLKKYLRAGVAYYPVDFKKRCGETIVCDFNKHEYPEAPADVYVLCAMLYYMDDPVALLKRCAENAKRKIIIALHSASLANYPEVFRVQGFKSYMYFDEIEELLRPYGFTATEDVTLTDAARRFVVYEKSGGTIPIRVLRTTNYFHSVGVPRGSGAE